MTQEEKAKRYDETLEIAKKNYITAQDLCEGSQIGVECFKNTLVNIFPELKESEDERIRKAILEGLIDCRDAPDLGWSNFGGIEIDDCIAWLEKLGNKPQGKSALEAIREEKVDNANKVEPNFNVGDWIIRNNKYTGIPVKVIEFNGYYSCELNGEVVNLTRNDVHNNFHLWTIQDAKDGDVLAFDNGTIVIFKDLYNSTSFHSYCYIECGIFDFNKDELPDWWEGEGFKPATKEQCNLLFQKMKEAGYEWDADKKELNKEE